MQSDSAGYAAIHVRYGLTSTTTAGSCASAIEVAHADVTLAPGVPLIVNPTSLAGPDTWCIPTDTPAQFYNVCADITTADITAVPGGMPRDDEVYSDRRFLVGPAVCTPPAFPVQLGCDGAALPTCPP